MCPVPPASAPAQAEAADRVARVRERLDDGQRREAAALAANWRSANQTS